MNVDFSKDFTKALDKLSGKISGKIMLIRKIFIEILVYVKI